MRVLVMNRTIRPRRFHLRSVNGSFANWFHNHSLSLRPNYDWRPLKFQN